MCIWTNTGYLVATIPQFAKMQHLHGACFLSSSSKLQEYLGLTLLSFESLLCMLQAIQIYVGMCRRGSRRMGGISTPMSGKS